MKRRIGLGLRILGVVGVVISLAATAFIGVAAPATAVGGLSVQRVNAFSAFDSAVYKSVRATCPAGMEVAGTGYQLLGAEGSVVLDDLIPDQTSVLVGAGEVVGPGEPSDGTTASWQIEATALCVPLSTGLQIVSATSDFKVTNTPFDKTQFVHLDCPGQTRTYGLGAALANGFGQVSISQLFPSDTVTGSEDDPITVPNTGASAVGATDLDGYTGAWSITVYAICGPATAGLHTISGATDFDSVSPKSLSAVCPAGQAVLSSGFYLGQPYSFEVVITKAEAELPDGSPNGSTLTATERAPGTGNSWAAIRYQICADGTNNPNSTTFNLTGRWDGRTGTTGPVVTDSNGIISVDMSAYGRPTARGGVIDSSHISVSFPDDKTYIGQLVAPNRISWSNGSFWLKR